MAPWLGLRSPAGNATASADSAPRWAEPHPAELCAAELLGGRSPASEVTTRDIRAGLVTVTPPPSRSADGESFRCIPWALLRLPPALAVASAPTAPRAPLPTPLRPPPPPTTSELAAAASDADTGILGDKTGPPSAPSGSTGSAGSTGAGRATFREASPTAAAAAPGEAAASAASGPAPSPAASARGSCRLRRRRATATRAPPKLGWRRTLVPPCRCQPLGRIRFWRRSGLQEARLRRGCLLAALELCLLCRMSRLGSAEPVWKRVRDAGPTRLGETRADGQGLCPTS
mmetsp:Transcript_19285/g.73895  ORF Transcript_19285/g.73895 Transcript_19285/m.73895 type:complete len:288 (+) Transcript_19285:1518-2381(+)